MESWEGVVAVVEEDEDDDKQRSDNLILDEPPQSFLTFCRVAVVSLASDLQQR